MNSTTTAPHLGLKQRQQMTMSPLMAESIHLLQLPALEIQEYVNTLTETNPFIELLSDSEQTPTAQAIEPSSSPSEALPIPSEPSSTEALIHADEMHVYAKDGSHWEFPTEHEDLSSPSLIDIIEQQLSHLQLSTKERIIATALIEMLEETGYIQLDCSALSQRLHCKEALIEAVLQKMQSLEPAGVFARTLAECLSLQLKDQGLHTPDFQCLLQHLHLVAAGSWKMLFKQLPLPPVTIQEMLKTLKMLNPKPGLQYKSHADSITAIADVMVYKDSTHHWRVELTAMSQPKIYIAKEYYGVVRSSAKKTGHHEADKNYVRSKWQEAEWLRKSLEQRASSLLKVTQSIVDWQQMFFHQGIEYLRPMTLRDIAQITSLHESTVSRVCQHKLLSTPMGTLPLRYFFSQTIASTSITQEEGASVQSIKNKLQQWIAKENPKQVLTDADLCLLFQQNSLKIARRTVAKYREALGIPTSQERKRKNRLQVMPL